MRSQVIRALFASTYLCAATVVGGATWAADAAGVPTVADGIGGVVTGPKGPEAGVWVIAESFDLGNRYIKIVVTDDQGRYLIPDLPKASYDVWVRGYGLVDSAHLKGTPGKNINHTAVVAPDLKAASKYYPANYWFALINLPAESEFPGTGPKGNGVAPTMKTQQMWISQMKGCIVCHQQGDIATRTLIDNTPEGWADRINRQRPDGDHVLGDHGKDFAAGMSNAMTQFGRSRGLQMWADWTKSVSEGALPKEAPPRPEGRERNLVLTMWDWANGRYVHDNVVSDRHDPKKFPNGYIYGVIGMLGYIEMIDPVTGKQKEVGYKVNLNKNVEILPPDQVPDAFPHNPMLDSKGRLWMTDLGRFGAPKPNGAPPPDKMPYCTDPSNKYAKYWPQPGKTTNTLVVYDDANQKIDGLPMCNGMHHLQFNVDQKTLYLSGGGNQVVSWADTDVFDKTHDPGKALGWCPMVLDTNSAHPEKAAARDEVSITPDRTQWNDNAGTGGGGGEEAGGAAAAKAIDPKKDTRIAGFLYGVDADVSDGGMWFAKTGPFPTGLVKFHTGTNPPETCHTEYFEPPKLPDGKNYAAFVCRGVSADSKGVAWAACASGSFGRFDPKACKTRSGIKVADGQHCPEGWSIYKSPGPSMGSVAGIGVSTDMHYLDWVDIHDTLGLGKDTPILAGSNSDSLLAFDDSAKKFIIMRVPYPMSFHTRGMDGRFDDLSKGWKGKGIYATYATEPVWHQEGGEDGTYGPSIVRFQMRPSPLTP